jgi:hypothetical protein
VVVSAPACQHPSGDSSLSNSDYKKPKAPQYNSTFPERIHRNIKEKKTDLKKQIHKYVPYDYPPVSRILP